jgi:hypothetical protein
MKLDRNPKPRLLLKAEVIWLCAIMLTAALAQALDSCELAASKSTQHVASADSVRAPGSCLICVAAHTTPFLISPAPAPVVVASRPALAPIKTVASAVRFFALYVRPPPAA